MLTLILLFLFRALAFLNKWVCIVLHVIMYHEYENNDDILYYRYWQRKLHKHKQQPLE